MGPKETVQAVYTAFGNGDMPRVLELMDPEVLLLTPVLPWSHGEYRGHEGLLDHVESQREALAEWTSRPDEFVISDDLVVALGVSSGTCKETGRSFTGRFVHIWSVEQGRVVRLRAHMETAMLTRAFDPELSRG